MTAFGSSPEKMRLNARCTARALAPALGLLVLELVEFGEDLHRNPDVIILETLEGKRVVKQDVGIQDEVLHPGLRRRGRRARRGAGGAALPGRRRGAIPGERRGMGGQWPLPLPFVRLFHFHGGRVIEWIELVHESRRMDG